MDIEEVFLITASCFVLAMMLFVLVYTPTLLYAQAQCYKQGYPAARVSYDFSYYCITLDGATKVLVKPQ